MSELADLFKLMDVADALLPSGTTLDKSATFNRLLTALDHSLPNHDKATAAIKSLRAVKKAHVALQHSGAAGDLHDALAELGIEYPIEDYGDAWDMVRSRAAEAVSALRKAVQAGIV